MKSSNKEYGDRRDELFVLLAETSANKQFYNSLIGVFCQPKQNTSVKFLHRMTV